MCGRAVPRGCPGRRLHQRLRHGLLVFVTNVRVVTLCRGACDPCLMCAVIGKRPSGLPPCGSPPGKPCSLVLVSLSPWSPSSPTSLESLHDRESFFDWVWG